MKASGNIYPKECTIHFKGQSYNYNFILSQIMANHLNQCLQRRNNQNCLLWIVRLANDIIKSIFLYHTFTSGYQFLEEKLKILFCN